MKEKTHELKIYANSKHKRAQYGDLLLHLWFIGEHLMQMDLDIARRRSDVAYVDLIDCQKFTTERLYPLALYIQPNLGDPYLSRS